MKNATIRVFPLIFFSIFNCGGMQQPTVTLTELTEFDRESFTDGEGYWAESQDTAHDCYKGKYPFPQPNTQPWHGKEEFLKKLALIEKTAKEFDFSSTDPVSGVYKLSTRGFSFSRLEANVRLGSSEFMLLSKHSNTRETRWTDVFGSYYVGKFNVKPSREFYNFVMKYALENKE